MPILSFCASVHLPFLCDARPARWQSLFWSRYASGCGLFVSDHPLSAPPFSWFGSAPACHRSASHCRSGSECCSPPPSCPPASFAPESHPASGPVPRCDHAAHGRSPARSLVPNGPASWRPAPSPYRSGRSCDTPRSPVLPVPAFRNSSCARASESACARPLPPAFVAGREADFADAAFPGPRRRHPPTPHLPTTHPRLASTVPTTRPLPRQTNSPTQLAVGAATGSSAFLLALGGVTAHTTF